MKKLIVSVLFASVGIGSSFADSLEAPSRDPADTAAIMQVEQGMGDAMVAGDIDRLARMYADDWQSIGSSGKAYTKEDLLNDFRSGKNRLISFENGPMDVQVFGNVAVAHGSVTEKSIGDGKDTSGETVWMDLLKKRAGRWVVERSAGARVK